MKIEINLIFHLKSIVKCWFTISQKSLSGLDDGFAFSGWCIRFQTQFHKMDIGREKWERVIGIIRIVANGINNWFGWSSGKLWFVNGSKNYLLHLPLLNWIIYCLCSSSGFVWNGIFQLEVKVINFFIGLDMDYFYLYYCNFF